MSTADGEPRSRSRPRGRSPSPSDFTRILSDLRKTRVSSDDTSRRNGTSTGVRVLEKKGSGELSRRVGENGVNGFRVSANRRENGNVGEKLMNSGEKVVSEESIANKMLSGKLKKEDTLALNCVNSNVNGVQHASLDGCTNQCNKDGNFRATDSVMDHKGDSGNRNVVLKPRAPSTERNATGSSFRELGMRNTSNSKGSDVCKERSVNEKGMGGHASNKSASKLQEKLAFLEGKVKRIASDIKKTKEILDMNNTDASKVMLSDIQEKISGIEEAMGNAIADFNTNLNSDCSGNLKNSKCTGTDTVQRTVHEANQNKQAEFAKISMKSLSSEELEARLFPHHELLKNCTSLKLSTSSRFQSNDKHVSNSNSGSKSETSMSLTDNNPIAIEFLASLNKEHSGLGAIDAGDSDEVKETGVTETSTMEQISESSAGKENTELDLQADENLDEFDDQENKPSMIVVEDMEDDSVSQLTEIGSKTSTGGWFVSEGESVLLAHDDGSCSFYDVANHEEKAEYRPPAGISKNLWKDCWIVRAASADGCSGKYVVAASAGNTLDSGFCSWDFYSKEVRAFHTEDNNKPTSRLAQGALPDNTFYRRNALADITPSPNRQWWYRPCGELIISTASCQRTVKVFDIRDGQQVMKWDVQKHVLAMEYCSPLQWRNKAKVVVAELEGVSLWDVSSLNPQALSTVSNSGRRISALHVHNTDGELGGGVRQRVSSSEAEGNDGVFCTSDSINIIDFRHPSGIGLKIPKVGVNVDCVFSRGDSVFLGCNGVSSGANKQASSQVLQFSLRRQKIVNTYQLPESNAHSHHKALTQVWGNSNLVMASSGLGLVVFDALKDEGSPSFAMDHSSSQKVKEVIGPDDLYLPSFDYHSSHVLLISRDRPAMWRHLS